MIRVEGLTKKFSIQHRRRGFLGTIHDLFQLRTSEKTALQNIRFTINSGEIVGCIGPNGAGKSTLIKILTSVLVPTSGQVTIQGRIPWKERQAHLRQIGVMFGSRGTIWQELPAIESFDLLAVMYGVEPKLYRKNLALLTEALDIGSLLNRPARELSLGQRMRCELASVFIHSPRIVFLDEPTIGLDIQVKQKIRDLIHFYNREQATTFIYTSHDLREVEEICPRLLILNEGQLIYDGRTEKLKNTVASNRRIRIQVYREDQLPLLAKYLEEVQSTAGPYSRQTMSGETLELKFDTSTFNISVFLGHVGLKHDWIRDIVIEDSSIEDIIHRVYAEQSLVESAG